MKIELDQPLSGKYRIGAYSSGGLVINETRYENSLILTPDEIIEGWPPRTYAELAPEHMQIVIHHEPEILLLGTGAQLRFPDNSVLEPLFSGNIGFEVMDTGAACRAYNFLMGEGRRVMAALLMIEPEDFNFH